MAAAIYHGGMIDWGGSRDAEGYRVYTLDMLIQSDADDGPFEAMNASGLPSIGSPWAFGNDDDPWAFCLPEMTVKRHQSPKQERWLWWVASLTFTNKPQRRCQDQSIENPLEEPPKLSGSFVRYQKPVEKDKNGKLILSSSHERITGLEKEANRPNVIIEMNDSSLDIGQFSAMVNCINDSELWGLPAKSVMLNDVSWSRLLYGTCSFYYTKRYTFDIKYEGWTEADIADRGFKKWNGVAADGGVNNPSNFEVIKDDKGENTPNPVMLKNGEVNPDPVGDPQFIPEVEFYEEANFLSLGIPSSLE